MYWIFGVEFVDLEDSYTVGGDPAMNIIIARVPVLNAPEYTLNKLIKQLHKQNHITHQMFLPIHYASHHSLSLSLLFLSLPIPSLNLSPSSLFLWLSF